MRIGSVNNPVTLEAMAARLAKPTTASQAPQASTAGPATSPADSDTVSAETFLGRGAPADQALATFALKQGLDAQSAPALQVVTGRAQA